MTGKKLIFNAFLMNTPAHLTSGLWTEEGDTSTTFQTIDHWIEVCTHIYYIVTY